MGTLSDFSATSIEGKDVALSSYDGTVVLVVNTASEYMYQMATIAHHTLAGTQTVVLPEDVTTDDGTVFKAGTYEVPVDGRYWSQFDRSNPLDASVRERSRSLPQPVKILRNEKPLSILPRQALTRKAVLDESWFNRI